MFELSISAGRYVVAVSGGVDSVVLLDLLAKKPELELIVAHFDHGIREDSRQDELFVAELAKKYGLKYESRREELGVDTSEAWARARRYNFLRSISDKYQARLITAHHADDVIETIAINLTRGTGWRGLAVLDSEIVRPLTGLTKAEILNYAKKNSLIWHEDSTNQSDKYLRNRIREKLKGLDEKKRLELMALWTYQKELKRQIDGGVRSVIETGLIYERVFFINLDEVVAIECLRYIVGARLTRPQMYSLLNKIKTSLPGKIYQTGRVKIKFASRNFTVELIK